MAIQSDGHSSGWSSDRISIRTVEIRLLVFRLWFVLRARLRVALRIIVSNHYMVLLYNYHKSFRVSSLRLSWFPVP
ncbi:hypothetical protein HanRHA438_Chr12g0542251 [Helianthus annuus]|nr:hypothetical protein HanRHA438_Chr12g0542251 [Helianthus annuus]